MNQFRELAESLKERQYFIIDDVTAVIEAHFKIWLSDIRNDQMLNDSIINKRNKLVSELEQISIQRSLIEKQLFDAKEDISRGLNVDKYWMARANLAFRIKKGQIVSLQNELANLNTLQKKRNIESSMGVERLIKKEVFAMLEDRIGRDETIELFKEAEEHIQNTF